MGQADFLRFAARFSRAMTFGQGGPMSSIRRIPRRVRAEMALPFAAFVAEKRVLKELDFRSVVLIDTVK